MSMTDITRRDALFTALQNESLDWGTAISESRMRKGLGSKILMALCFLTGFAASIFVLPMLVGFLLKAEMQGLALNALIVLGCIALAMIFNMQSRKGPRNALEIDHDAAEVRLGSKTPKGAFVRHRVLPLAKIADVFVRPSENGQNTLNFIVGAEQLTIALSNSKPERLDGIAAQIREAAHRARTAPRRSRIQSALVGIGANYREIGNRVKSSIYS